MKLSKYHYPQVVTALCDVLSSDEWWYVRVAAAWSLGKLRDPGAISNLADSLAVGHLAVRYAAADALGEISGHDSVMVLCSGLIDEDDTIAWRCARALDKAPAIDLGVEPCLLAALAKDRDWVEETPHSLRIILESVLKRIERLRRARPIVALAPSDEQNETLPLPSAQTPHQK